MNSTQQQLSKSSYGNSATGREQCPLFLAYLWSFIHPTIRSRYTESPGFSVNTKKRSELSTTIALQMQKKMVSDGRAKLLVSYGYNMYCKRMRDGRNFFDKPFNEDYEMFDWVPKWVSGSESKLYYKISYAWY